MNKVTYTRGSLHWKIRFCLYHTFVLFWLMLMRFDERKTGKRMTTWISKALEAVIGIVISSPRSADGKAQIILSSNII